MPLRLSRCGDIRYAAILVLGQFETKVSQVQGQLGLYNKISLRERGTGKKEAGRRDT